MSDQYKKACERFASRQNVQGTHWDDCWNSGPEHYECARTRIARLTGDLRGANRECEVRQERELGYLARAESAEAEVKRLRAANAQLVAELESIAIANPLRWEFDMRDQFQAWAQNRARAAIEAARGES